MQSKMESAHDAAAAEMYEVIDQITAIFEECGLVFQDRQLALAAL
jgi:hypothetical protein